MSVGAPWLAVPFSCADFVTTGDVTMRDLTTLDKLVEEILGAAVTLFEEVSAVTIPGHVTIYCRQPESLPQLGATRLGIFAVAVIGILRSETFGHSRALKAEWPTSYQE